MRWFSADVDFCYLRKHVCKPQRLSQRNVNLVPRNVASMECLTYLLCFAIPHIVQKKGATTAQAANEQLHSSGNNCQLCCPSSCIFSSCSDQQSHLTDPCNGHLMQAFQKCPKMPASNPKLHSLNTSTDL